ncbi:hypothetical protein BS78_02G076300 [Paspalum vaginatum]|nr:hypothetical protein BS78_02G076300 [Paspalum vaginatum]
MNPDIQYLLDEMTKRLDDHDAKLEERLGDLDAKLDQRLVDRDEFLERRFQDLDAKWDEQLASFSASNDKRLSRIETAASTFDDWRHEIEGTVDDMRLNVGKLSKFCERSAVEKPIDMTGVLTPNSSSAAAARPSAAGTTAARPNGHRVELNSWADGFGVVTTLDHLPANGALPPPNSHSRVVGLDHSASGARAYGRDCDSGRGKLPKLHFPQFDGSQPKLWISRCEDYFDLYGVWITTCEFGSLACISLILQHAGCSPWNREPAPALGLNFAV